MVVPQWLRSLIDHWGDTTTPHGRLMVTVLAGLAEFERGADPHSNRRRCRPASFAVLIAT